MALVLILLLRIGPTTLHIWGSIDGPILCTRCSPEWPGLVWASERAVAVSGCLGDPWQSKELAKKACSCWVWWLLCEFFFVLARHSNE